MVRSLATTALAVAALAASLVQARQPDPSGGIVLINKGTETITCNEVPGPPPNGQQTSYDKSLETTYPIPPGGRVVRPLHVLDSAQGVSIKMTRPNVGQCLQFEYTVHGDGNLWYDLSAVDGNPFKGVPNAFWSNTSRAWPFERAYRYPTDDAFAMQSSVADSSFIFYQLFSDDPEAPAYFRAPCDAQFADTCPQSSILGGGQPAPSQTEVTPSQPASSSSQPISSSDPPAPTSSADTQQGQGWNGHGIQRNAVGPAATPGSSSDNTIDQNAQVPAGPHTTIVTHIKTAIAVETVTEYVKRHEHHRRAH